MDDERQRQAVKIFADVLEMPPAEWDEYLDRVCGEDAELLQEVRSLLKALPDAEAFFGEASDT